ncbi:hypothetical protein [Bacillus cereus group sp. BfR-BA-01380]|uniref:hypothetical protein n=1 Tax=Bacillus cereus group sp. BfR-BA-01380 TaxID=2920324 RepID=UPI001F5A614E|nr:hypothetical protein [Bacillus cereus group sp. BfR-BA-01380]
MSKYSNLYVSLKSIDDQVMLFSQENFSTILDHLNKDKFIMLFERVDELYLPCAVNTDDIISIFQGTE